MAASGSSGLSPRLARFMSLPGGITATAVTGTYTTATGSPLNGSITFQPSTELTDAALGVDIPPYPLTYQLANGAFTTAPLVDDSNTGLGPAGWAYQVTLEITGLGAQTWFVQIPHSSSPVDISSLAPVLPQAFTPGDLPLSGGTLTGPLVLGGTPALVVPAGAGAGKVLTSDGSGNGSWAAVKSRAVTATAGPAGSAADYVCTGTADDVTLNAAITAVNTAGGGELRVRAGAYSLAGTVILKSGVHVTLEAGAVLTLGNGVNLPAVGSATGGLVDVTLSGGVIDGNGAGQTGSGTSNACVDINGGAVALDGVLVENVRVQNTYKHGIFFHNVPSPYTGKRAVRHCTVYNHGAAGFGLGGFGIYCDYAPYTLIEGNYIEKSNNNDSIELGHVGGLVCVGNRIADGGIQFPFSHNSIIIGNVMEAPYAQGIQNDANTANNVVIAGNTVNGATPGSGYAGISVYGSAPVISGNNVTVKAQNGIRVFNASGAAITGNNVTGPWTAITGTAGTGIISDAGSNSVSITGNLVTGFARGIGIVDDVVSAVGNQLAACSVGVGLSNSSSSGHVIAGALIDGNNFSGNVTDFDPQNQNGYTLIYRNTSGGTASSLNIGSTDYKATELYVEQPNSSSSKDTLSLSNAGTGDLLRGYSGASSSAHLTSIGKLTLGINGLVAIDGSQGSVIQSTSLSVANLISATHTGATGTGLNVSRTGNSSSLVKGLNVAATNSGAGGAAAISATGGTVTDALAVTGLTGVMVAAGAGNCTAVTAPAGALVGTTDTQTLTGKRVTKRVETLTDAATVTPASDTNDGGKLLTLSQSTTIANPTGTPTPFQQYVLRVTSASAQALTWGGAYRGSTALPLPALTTGGAKTDYLGFQWNADSSTWDMLALSQGY